MNDGQQPPSPAGPSLILLTLLPLFSLCFTATEECLRPFQLRLCVLRWEKMKAMMVWRSARQPEEKLKTSMYKN